ncbi:conserved lipoprotein/antigen [Mycolicibacterium rhodesiae NBB3]|jgi:lipoprotein LpqH|uniref:Conserved lipoprotein/antigen n=1 Tax=Mycolicibacterium rhodesiae (strain NBB3) TaxID=710685 RepID=G8RQ47_MYCRN|nr:lipoprotein LpqH [Mycolicibacterium rhodesiae]AEV75120.1 conserved lipoprotein/antigen [Mycolicibacterium rhodesiae NBB3]
MNRVVAGVVGLAVGAAVLVGCSDDKPAAAPSSGNGNTQVSTSGKTEVKVGGSDLAGLDLNSVTCVKQGGKINVASAAINGQAGLAVVMTDEATPTVESLGMSVDGNALAVTNMMGAKTGSAEVKVDGATYTITGEAQGADMANPMAGMITKPFEIKVTCT